MNLSLTVDYELFGDGYGDVFNDLIEPTRRLLDFCKCHDIRMTFFFEVVEYWKLKELWESGDNMGYLECPTTAMEKQMQDAYNDGHDVQLHIHPQWLNAMYACDRWRVDSHWLMSDIPLNANDKFDISLDEVIARGVSTLENIIQPINKKYQCNIFRAGGFNITPSENIIRVLNRHNFIIDSSVFSGGFESNTRSSYDYKKIKNADYWMIENNNVLIQRSKNISSEFMMEIPIFALPIYRILKYDLTRIRSAFNNKNSAMKNVQNRMAQKSFIQKVLFYFQKESITWDFCLFSTHKTKYFYTKAKKIMSLPESKQSYFVLIGHSKSYYSSKNLEFLVEQEGVKFKTLKEIYASFKGQE